MQQERARSVRAPRETGFRARRSHRIYLIVSALGFAVIGTSYGAAPQRFMAWMFDVVVRPPDETHVLRGVMGLYWGIAAFLVLGALDVRATRTVVTGTILLMAGLATGRIVSWIVDGRPHGLLVAYLGLEVVFAALGLLLLGPSRTRSETPRRRR